MRYLSNLIICALAVAIVLAAICLFRNRAAALPPTPSWAGHLTPTQYQHFIDRIRDYFSVQHLDAAVGDGVVISRGTRYGLQNIAQSCARLPESEWPDAIAKHFATLRQAPSLPAGSVPFAEAKGHLGLCIKAEIDVPLDKLVYWRDLPGLVTYLVLDGTDTVRTVPLEDLQNWKQSPADLRPLALAYTRSAVQLHQEKVVADKGLTFIVLAGDNIFAASNILALPQFSGALGKYGALAAIPKDQGIISYPINDASVLRAVDVLALLAKRQFDRGPGSISPNIYYVHDGTFSLIKTEITSDNIIIYPPKDFTDMLINNFGQSVSTTQSFARP